MCWFCNYWNIITSGVTVLISIGTLLLAWRIYKNFDVKKSFLNEQLKLICELSNSIYSTGIPANFASSGNCTTNRRLISFVKDYPKDERYKSLYLTTPFVEDVLPFLTYRHNMLLPSNMTALLQQFDVIEYKRVLPSELPSFYCIIYHYNENGEQGKRETLYYFMEFERFEELTKKLLMAIAEWLKKYGAKDINLPFDTIPSLAVI